MRVLLTLFVLFCFTGNAHAGFFLFKPQQKKEVKKEHTRDERDEFMKFLRRYRAQKVLPPKKSVDLDKVKILGYYNDRCMLEYKGDKYLVSQKLCREIELKKIKLLREIGR